MIGLFFEMGWKHILDLKGFDHILFVVVLCSNYMLKDWKRVLVLVTAFTIGHSITLAVATFDLIAYNKGLIEFAIPLTIFITALSNVISREKFELFEFLPLNYLYALCFGFIHGFGFSSYLKSILPTEGLVKPLLFFNIGIEAGQLLIVAIYLFTTFIFIHLLSIPKIRWNSILSSIVMGMSIMMMIEQKFW